MNVLKLRTIFFQGKSRDRFVAFMATFLTKGPFIATQLDVELS